MTQQHHFSGVDPSGSTLSIDREQITRFVTAINHPRPIYAVFGERGGNFLDLDKAIAMLQRYPGHSLGLRIGVAKPEPIVHANKVWGTKNQHIDGFQCLFAECDGGLSHSEQAELPVRAGLPQPSLQVDTGGKSIHHYWVLNEVIDVPRWSVLQLGIAAKLNNFCPEAGADESLADASQVMRLPGVPHPETNRMSRLLEVLA